ncbi:MAG: Crp/Fnr family transcriptional regulator [Elusimicrobia bacterium]|nr:Crp/Fnr family transcriptional regulator [Elusimicrobiota bacterium]
MLKMLRKIPFLGQLTPRDLREVHKISRIREYGPGENVFTKAQSANQMFVVLSGRIKIFTHSGGKKRKTFAYLDPGDFFGEMALLEGKPRSASAEAVSYTRLLVITYTEFRKLLLSDPMLTLYLLRTVCQRLRKANEAIEGMMFRNILGRVAQALCDLGRRGRKVHGGIELGEHYTQQELADLVGTTREPLTRALSTLRRVQLIETTDGRYFIKDPVKLAALGLV